KTRIYDASGSVLKAEVLLNHASMKSQRPALELRRPVGHAGVGWKAASARSLKRGHRPVHPSVEVRLGTLSAEHRRVPRARPHQELLHVGIKKPPLLGREGAVAVAARLPIAHAIVETVGLPDGVRDRSRGEGAIDAEP